MIDRDSWIRAKEIGHIPTGSCQQVSQVNLNHLDSVEAIAAAYYEPDEEPITLEIDTSLFDAKLEWSEPNEIKPWKHALAKIEAIPLNAVTNIYEFGHSRLNNRNVFKLVSK